MKRLLWAELLRELRAVRISATSAESDDLTRRRQPVVAVRAQPQPSGRDIDQDAGRGGSYSVARCVHRRGRSPFRCTALQRLHMSAVGPSIIERPDTTAAAVAARGTRPIKTILEPRSKWQAIELR